MILVNDGSPDHSRAAIERLCQGRPDVAGIDLRRNFGLDNAIVAGLWFARGRAVAIIDDIQHDPADLSALLAKHGDGGDVVYADFQAKHQALWKNPGSWFNGKVVSGS